MNENCNFDKHKNIIGFGMIIMAVLIFAQLAAVICLFFKVYDKPYSFSIDKPQIHVHNYNDGEVEVDNGTLDDFVDMDADILQFEEVMKKTFNQDAVIPRCNNPERPGQHIIKQPDKKPKVDPKSSKTTVKPIKK